MIAFAYTVTWWRCDEDGLCYWEGPRHRERLDRLMTWHIHYGHEGNPPRGRYRSWIVYVTQTAPVDGEFHGVSD